jgi:glycosyltransferase involved in cell wall biosynthesis
MGPLRVAVVADILLSPMGGVARSVQGILDELATLDQNRLEITVVARSRPASINGMRFQRSFAPRVPKLSDAIFALQRPLTLRGYDVVHYIDSRPPLDFAVGRTRQVITQHGFAMLMWPEDYASEYVRMNRALLRIAPHADLTLTASRSERRELLELNPRIDPDRVVAIHHGVDHHRFFVPDDPGASTDYVRREFGIEGRYVLYVSNHQRKKNTERLVEAFARLAAEQDDVTLALTGWHSRSFHLVEQKIAELGIGHRVQVLGHVSDEALPHLYVAASAFALPSLHEGFGIPVLEAMACGTPVLASDVYALAEVCGDAAELVDPYDVEAIAAGLHRLLEDDARTAELRERGLARAAEFTWRRSAERHLECYESVM